MDYLTLNTELSLKLLDAYISSEKLSDKMKAIEKIIIRETLIRFDGNISKTAKKLGIGRMTIYRKYLNDLKDRKQNG